MEPRKWKKYKLLVDFGIKAKSDLDTITRYDAGDFLKCLDNIKSELGSTEFDTNLALLIPQNETQSLPQFFTRTDEEFEETYKRLSQIDTARFQEIWHFRSKSDPNRFWGRQHFGFDELFPRIASSTVELLPRSAGRIINQYPNVPDGYVRLEKKGNYPFEIAESIVKTPAGEKLVNNAEKIGRALSFKQKQLIEFGSFIYAQGGHNVTFDFHYTDNQVKILDWDSDNEARILDRMEILLLLYNI